MTFRIEINFGDRHEFAMWNSVSVPLAICRPPSIFPGW
jgi:hypothetical protein